MATQFSYSILQYKHSLLLNESINIGIVFSFPDTHDIFLTVGNIQRVKCVYPDFESSLINDLIKSIRYKISENKLRDKSNDLFSDKDYSFKKYLDTLLLPDSTAFQFSEVFNSLNTFESTKKAIDEFSKLLLPDSELKREEEPTRNEQYILKKLTDSIASKNIVIDHRMSRNKLIQTKGIKINFELAWSNGVTHLIKPISFDLKQEQEIQRKSVTFFGYLDLLSDYAKLHEYSFDLLIGKPTNPQLLDSYQNALDVLNEATAPKDIITEEELETYSEQTAEILHTKDL